MSRVYHDVIVTKELRASKFSSSSGDTSQSIVLVDPTNFATGTTTGVKIGTSASQKFGFFGATPVAQQATTGTTTGFTAGAGSAVLSDSTFTGNSGTAAYTIGDIVLALKNLGFLASS